MVEHVSRPRRHRRSKLILAVVVAAVLVSVITLQLRPPAPPVERDFPSARRYRLHVSDAELAIWRDRAEHGPYKMEGDVSKGSPGDWTRITEYTEGFMSDPEAGRWTGPVKNNPGGCVLRRGEAAGNLGHQPPVTEASAMRDAAFYALVEKSEKHAEAVREQLLAQAQEPDVNFGDRQRWCLGEIFDGSPGFMVATWLTKHLYAMNYLEEYDQNIFTREERALLLGWFSDAAEWMRHDTDVKLDELFVDRPHGDDKLTDVATEDGWEEVLYYNGPAVTTLHMRFNNRNARQARFVTLVGIVADNQRFMDHGEQYVKDALAYAYFPQGAVSDFQRWEDTDPAKGWKYGAEFVGSLLTIADHLARGGDTELYEYATTDGALGSQGEHHSGGPKTLETLVIDMMRYVDHTYTRYGTDKDYRAGDPDYLIDTTVEPTDEELINDLMMIMANMYYQNPYIRSVYTRQAEGAPPYPDNPRHGSGDPEGGEAGTYPGALFMFGQTEDKVSPYGR